MNVALNTALHPAGSRLPFFERLLEHIHEIPGTASVTMTSAAFPSGPRGSLTIPPIDGQPSRRTDDGTRVRYRAVTPGFFQTFGIPILQGRAFVETDRRAERTVVLSESAAKILFPGQNPIGHTVDTAVNEWAEVIGVARDIRNAGPMLKPEPELYVLLPSAYDGTTYTRNPGFDSSTMYFAVRTQSGTADATAFLKQAVADLDPKLPVTAVTVEPLGDQIARLTERPRFLAWLLSAFSGLALLLAAAGLYGVASYLVTQRTRDIGVRIALGASATDISRQVVSEAGRWIAVGAVIGCVLAWISTRAIKAQLYG